ncbi:angiopoietin-2-like [Littorina saxatilis]|uniref:angiopoietin-2-like n=1 Tax=Littorina saxatilis TaxID=31220 RepID=UPI0038B6A255
MYGGLTYPLCRLVSGTSWSSATWTQVKDGFGDDLNVDPDPNKLKYFIGLDKLHQLLNQARYTFSIHCKYGSALEGTAVARYRNFTLGPEASGYQLSYNGPFLYDTTDPAEDGLQSGSPFAAPGNDGNGCAGSRGAPGWYGPACSGHSMFADPPTWPVPVDGTVDLKQQLVALTRANPFIDDD